MRFVWFAFLVLLIPAPGGSVMLVNDYSSFAAGVLLPGDEDNTRDDPASIVNCIQVLRPARVTVTIVPSADDTVEVEVEFVEATRTATLSAARPTATFSGTARDGCITDVTLRAGSGAAAVPYSVQDQSGGATS